MNWLFFQYIYQTLFVYDVADLTRQMWCPQMWCPQTVLNNFINVGVKNIILCFINMARCLLTSMAYNFITYCNMETACTLIIIWMTSKFCEWYCYTLYSVGVSLYEMVPIKMIQYFSNFFYYCNWLGFYSKSSPLLSEPIHFVKVVYSQ